MNDSVAPRARTHSRTRIPELMLWGALLFVIGLEFRSLSGWPARIALYGDDEATTGPPYAEIVSFAHGVHLYADVPGEFHAAIYGPLYYLLGRALTYSFDSSLELPPAVRSNTLQKAYVWLPKKSSIESATP